MTVGQSLRAASIIGLEFVGRIEADCRLDYHPAITPEISGRAWITGIHQHILDPDDPWPSGCRLDCL
ncbi:MAG: proline racemase family protein [Geminicoccaceae bacterium]